MLTEIESTESHLEPRNGVFKDHGGVRLLLRGAFL